MMRGTFCDWLINQGVTFHPETVIIDITSVEKHILENDVADELLDIDNIAIKEVTLPPFDYIFFESHSDFASFGVYAFKLPKIDDAWVGEGESDKWIAYSLCPVMKFKDRNVFYIDNNSVFEWSMAGVYEAFSYGSGIDDWIHDQVEGYNSSFDFDWYESKDFVIFSSILHALKFLHQKAEVELVDYPRNYRRRELRKNGKEPSPYFRIVAPGKPVKKNVGQSVGTGNKIQLPLHTVRGHFRTVQNHPIEWFNGTFWIAAHTRGNEELGKLQAHYKIRLPEHESIAS